MATYQRHVVGQYRLGEALQSECANLFGGDTSFEFGVDPLAEQNLAVLGLGTKTGGNIAYRTDRGITGAFGKADLAERRVTLCDAGAKPPIAAALAPDGIGEPAASRIATAILT